MSRLIFLPLLWLIIATANAASQCEANCFCGNNVGQLPIPAPKGFFLAAACDVSDVHYKSIDLRKATALPPDTFDFGTYFYRGTATMTGGIQKIDDGPNGTMVYFYPRIARSDKRAGLSRLQRFALLDRIMLSDSETIGTTNLTATEKVGWCADATLAFRELSIYIADTEGTGVGAVKYDVVRVGKYRRC